MLCFNLFVSVSFCLSLSLLLSLSLHLSLHRHLTCPVLPSSPFCSKSVVNHNEALQSWADDEEVADTVEAIIMRAKNKKKDTKVGFLPHNSGYGGEDCLTLLP